MAAQPGTSKQDFRNNASNIESARFLKRILQKADDEMSKVAGRNVPEPLERAYNFTGLDKRVLPLLKDETTIKNRIDITEIRDIERPLIHSHLLAFYLNESITSFRLSLVPTTKNLYRSVHGKIPIHVDIRTFRKHLAKMGYVWLKISKGYVVMERPTVTFERYYYLKDIVRCREEGREIFYVDETVLTCEFSYYTLKKYKSLMKAAAKGGYLVSQKDLVKNIFAVSHTGIYASTTVDEFNQSCFKNWMINDLLPILPERSVIVIQSVAHHDDTIKKPTLYSLKSDMTDWLDQTDIPYDENMSKCELITLIDTFTTDIDEFSKIETSFKLKGHELLRLPTSVDDMTPAKHLFELMKPNVSMADNFKVAIVEVQQAVSTETLEKYCREIVEYERETLKNDMRMDEIFDEVIKGLLNVRVREPEDSEVPFSDSD